MPDYRVKISSIWDHHALQNLSSNLTAKISRIDSKLGLSDYYFFVAFASLEFYLFDYFFHVHFGRSYKHLVGYP
jgi:hypothetical protein